MGAIKNRLYRCRNAAAALAEFFLGPEITTPWFLWTTPAWLAWYLYATGRFGGGRAAAGAIAAT